MDTLGQTIPRSGGAEQSTLSAPTAPLLEGFDLREIFSKIWRRKGIIIATVIILSLIATIVLYQLTPLYTANARVLIESRGANILNLEELLRRTGVEGDTIASEIQVLTSRRLAEKLTDQLGLDGDPEFNAKLRPVGLMSTILGYLNPRQFIPKEWLAGADSEDAGELSAEDRLEKERTSIINAVLANLEVDQVGFSRVIRISFTSENPNTAATVANTLGEIYIVDQLDAKYEATRRTTEWLSGKIADLRQRVDESEKAVEEFRRQAGLLQGTTGSTLVSQEISDLNAQLIVAQTARAEAEVRLSQVERLIRRSGGAFSAAEVLGSGLIQNLQIQESQVKRKLAEFSGEYGDRHPKMINARAELRDLQGKIASEVNKVVEGLRNNVGVAQAREAALTASLDKLKGRLAQSNTSEVQLRALEREAEADKALLESFLAEFEAKSAQQDINSQQPDARIISEASIPTSASFPKRNLFLAMVVVGSVIIGIFLVFVVEQLDRGFRSGEQIEKMLGASVLSLVPTLTGLVKGRLSPHQYILDKPTSAYGEAVRSLYTSLLLSHVDAPPKTVVFTSAQSGEGKTTLALSLARMLARSGRKVILLDTDLRKPRVSRFLNLPAEPGLVELLVGEAKLEEAVRIDDASGAYIVPAGKFASNAADIISSEQMRRLVEGLAQSYDLVILDSPPVLAVSDARILARIVDRVVFVVQWADTRRELVSSAVKQIVSSGGKLAGIVLSQVNVRKHAQYGFADSGYYYGRIKKYYID